MRLSEGVVWVDEENKRSQKRRALVATVAVVKAGRKGAQFGICNDISETGIQVICNSADVGSR